MLERSTERRRGVRTLTTVATTPVALCMLLAALGCGHAGEGPQPEPQRGPVKIALAPQAGTPATQVSAPAAPASSALPAASPPASDHSAAEDEPQFGARRGA